MWDPSSELETMVYAKKVDFIEIARKLGLTVKTNMRKAEICDMIIHHYMNTKILGDTAREYLSDKIPSDTLTPEQKLEFEKLALEREKAHLAVQQMKEKAQLDIQQQREKFEMDKARMELEASLVIKVESEKLKISNTIVPPFDLAKNLKLLPTFTEYDPDDYFKVFEEMADHFQWPREQWVWLLKPKLTGKAVKAVRHLENTSDYNFVKQAILDAFSITEEGYRQSFRDLTKKGFQTYLEFASEKLRAFSKWLKAAEVETFDQLVNLIVFEEFKRKLPLPIMLHIEDRQEKNLKVAASLADTYSLIHKSNASKKAEVFVKPVPVKNSDTLDDNARLNRDTHFSLKCSYCKKDGHKIQNCKNPKCRTSELFRSSFTHPSIKTDNEKSKPVSNVMVQKPIDLFKEFKFDGEISLRECDEKNSVTVLRDTGAALSLLNVKALPNVKTCLTGEKVFVKDLSNTTSIPLAEIYLNCPLVNGKVTVGIWDADMPVEGVNLLLGNDLAGSLTVPNLLVSCNPVLDFTQMPVESEPSIFPDTVVTRSQTLNDDVPVKGQGGNILTDIMSRDNLIQAQLDDENLTALHNQAMNINEVDKSPCFYYDNGLLMRFYRPPKRSNLDSWSEKRQIVIPMSVRHSILQVAHDGPGGHLGLYKTYHKILNHFFWPNLRGDVKEFLKTCHTCQLAGKPNQIIPKAPLQPITVPHEPFDKLIVDCVGPLPKTKKGNEYLLTVMCPTTRFPDAIPLKNISARNVANHLLKIFTVHGIPREIQSDRGTNFTSDLFSSILRELNVKQILSSAYHPESQGVLERWHQTFKSMLRKFCIENNPNWDEGIDYLLFAIREAPQESTGFSPFELLYGRNLRGPLALIKEEWLNASTEFKNRTVQQYMDKLQDTLRKVREVARQNLTSAQLDMKVSYDRNTKARKFSKGDLVLAYFPLPGSPLKSKYYGPYKVLDNVNNNTYVIETPDRKKSSQLVHINLLKEYHSRTAGAGYRDLNVSASVSVVNNKEKENFDVPYHELKINSEVLKRLHFKLDHLSESQSLQLQNLINSYLPLFNDYPGRCTVLKHEVRLIPGATPIRQQPYRVSPAKKQVMKEEVQYLLKHGLATPSKSPWASPCLLVPKEGGSMRVCTDYRKVNMVTIKDSYPLPRVDDIIDAIGTAKFATKIDLLKGYYQIELSDSAKEISAFITPFGLFEYTVMPFGMSNAPATFQRIINHSIQDLEGAYAYLDDIVVVGDTWDEHFERLHKLLQRLKEVGLTINLCKTSFCQATVTYLGHIVGNGNIRPKTANVEAILKYPVPNSKKSLRKFLGMTSYYRRFCRNFSSVANPLTNLLSLKCKFIWSTECQSAFDQLKLLLANDPVLQSPDFSKLFILQVDACDSGAGGVLFQKSAADGLLHPVSYTSSKFKKHQMAYSTIEKELLSLVLALQKFECYLIGAEKIEVFTDHNPLVFLEQTKTHNQRLLRWALYLQGFN